MTISNLKRNNTKFSHEIFKSRVLKPLILDISRIFTNILLTLSISLWINGRIEHYFIKTVTSNFIKSFIYARKKQDYSLIARLLLI